MWETKTSSLSWPYFKRASQISKVILTTHVGWPTQELPDRVEKGLVEEKWKTLVQCIKSLSDNQTAPHTLKIIVTELQSLSVKVKNGVALTIDDFNIKKKHQSDAQLSLQIRQLLLLLPPCLAPPPILLETFLHHHPLLLRMQVTKVMRRSCRPLISIESMISAIDWHRLP